MKCSLIHRKIPLEHPFEAAFQTVDFVDDLAFMLEAGINRLETICAI